MLLKAPFYENAKGDIMEIKFSIIIPVYNAEKYLSRCIESVLNSTLKEIEVICVNDASRDNSAVILERLRKKDSRVTVVTFEENRGVAAARNTGLDLAKGTIIGFVDSDDWIESFHLADIYAKMQKERSELNFISFKFVKPDKVIYYPDLTQYIEKFGSATQKMDCVEKITLLDDFCWRLAIRRSFWESSKTYFPVGIKGSEDQCFWKPLEMKASRVSFLENYGYNWFWNAESLTKQELSSFATIQGIDELMKRLPLEYHLPLMEKCCKRIHDFKMKNQSIQNALKKAYVARVYAKARECGIKGYELTDYSYSGIISVAKTKDRKIVRILGIKAYEVQYKEKRKYVSFLGMTLYGGRYETKEAVFNRC